MARKKPLTAEPELVPDDEVVDAKPIKAPTRKVVESKVITYEQSADDLEDDEEIESEEFEIKEKPKRKKPSLKDERDKLRAELEKNGVTPASSLRVYISKYVNENDQQGGMFADVEDFGKYHITKEALLRGDHMDIARRFGPGRYFFKVYLENTLVKHFDGRIGASGQIGTINGQIGTNTSQHFVSPDPANPGQVIVQMPAQQQVNPVDPFAEFDKTLKMFERMQKVFGQVGHPPQAENPQPQLSPEQQLATVLLTDPDVKKKAVKSLLGSNGESGEANTLELILTHAESIGKALEGVIAGLFNNVQSMRGSNGQPQMAQTAFQDRREGQGQTLNESGHPDRQYLSEAQQESFQGIPASGHGNAMQGNESAQPVSPEDQLLMLVLDQCKRRLPAKIAAQRCLALADMIEAQAPWMSLYPVIEMFISIEPDAAIAFIEQYSEQAKEIASLPHAKEWTAQLQAELKSTYETGGDDNGVQSQ